jgi:hypothetical protein
MKIQVTDSISLDINLDDSSVSVDINLKGDDDISLVELSKLIQRNSCITSIYFRDNDDIGYLSTLSIDGWREVFQVLQINTTIQSLRFSNGNLNLEWAQLFATMVLFNNNTVTDLRICNSSEIGINGVCAIVNALCTKPEGCTLTSLVLEGLFETDSFDNDTVIATQLGQAFVTLLQLKSTKLKKLSLRSDDFTDAIMDTVVSGLKYNTNLQELHLTADTTFNTAALANAMYYNRTLNHLHLWCNVINQYGVNELMTALRYHPSLEILSGRFHGAEVALEEMLQLLKYNEVLNELVLIGYGIPMRLSSFVDTATVESIFDYNNTIHVFPNLAMAGFGEGEERIEFIDGMLTKNKCGHRTAIKKGVPRRQDIFLWLYNSWTSTVHAALQPPPMSMRLSERD